MRLTKSSHWTLVLIATIFISTLARADGLATAVVTQSGSATIFTAEGTIEAVQSSVIAPQVSGSVMALPVKVGDHVKAGQLLARIDTRLATQQAMSSQAQVSAAQAQMSAAKNEYERKRRLYAQQYISQAALERAESDYKTAVAQTKAQLAQTGVSNVQTGLHTINAPYTGVIADVMAEVGDMAMPGKPLLSVYNPNVLRAVINVPQSQLAGLKHGENVTVLISAANEAERSLISTQMTILPTADSVSNMVKVRLTLPQGLTSITPGMFVRAALPISVAQGQEQEQLQIPAKAVVRRSELVAVYVVDSQGRPSLRQVRLGRQSGENVEVFAGLQAGEKVALDPIAAANIK
ncbi:multidrug resistance protein MdtA precursor [mine drainage metagenome]|uniref:Multidrug resistance protein MdtA n=1 Tax=mine drainage metagenome TaxID=410659 RepID=A0A1J5TNA7_9ZZZZ